MDWDINPQQVAEVLKTTAGEAQKFDKLSKSYADTAERLIRQAQKTMVGQAAGDVLMHYKDAWPDIVAQVQASLTGAQDATINYLNGDHEMALTAQRGAVDAAGQRRQREAQADRGAHDARATGPA